jgi:phosphoserine phosphatase RsbX
MEETIDPIIDWGVASLPLAGEERSGDAFAVKAWRGKSLVAAIDGLGHGEQAATAAGMAVETLMSHASASSDIVALVRRCHDSLMRTRGAVLSLALFDAGNDAMTWLGIGNVEGLLLHADPRRKPASESLLLRGGVVGYHLPSLRPSTTHLGPGDILIFSTDGIRSGFAGEINPEASPQQIADTIIMNYNRKTDDALVLVVRYNSGVL